MSSTYTVQDSVNFAQLFIRQMPLVGVGGVANEPAISIANIILGTMLGAPFAWPWNRAESSFSTVSGTQDYREALASFGFIEKSFIAADEAIELETALVLSTDTTPGRSNYIAPQLDDGNGNITFRLVPPPDGAYTVSLVTQNKAPLITSINSVWAPLPDEYAYIYNMGFLGLALLYANDQRAAWAIQRFLASLLGVSQGLSDQQKNVFLGNFLALSGQAVASQLSAQMGVHARTGA